MDELIDIETILTNYDEGIDISIQDIDKKTELHNSSENGYLNICELLIDNGININSKDSKAETNLKIS